MSGKVNEETVYVYSVVRFVPDTGRGEQVNIGVAVCSPNGEAMEVRFVEDLSRARAIGNFIESAMEYMGRVLHEKPLSASRLEHLSKTRRGIVQFTKPMPVVGL